MYLNLGELSQHSPGWLVKKQSCRKQLGPLDIFLSPFSYITVKKKLRETGKKKATNGEDITQKQKIG